jgi:hypothetical protein
VQLPVRILHAAPAEPAIVVDGFFPDTTGGGLNLSHWPGHSTPAHLRHDLSTGSALAFGRLEDTERAALAGRCTAIVNNHYDTDGSCALFAVRHPDLALPRAEQLLAAAAAGDFYRCRDEDALAVDALVTGLADAERSPLGAELVGCDDLGRHQRATEHLLERLPAILDGDRAPYVDLIEPVLDRTRADVAALEAAERADDPELDLAVFTARPGAAFAPGRHALFGTSLADRVLALAAVDGGTTCRFLVSTLSWFDLVSRAARARPDLDALVARLDELEGTGPDAQLAWRTQSASGATPELWFGAAELEPFAEHNDALAPSALSPATILAELRAGLL